MSRFLVPAIALFGCVVFTILAGLACYQLQALDAIHPGQNVATAGCFVVIVSLVSIGWAALVWVRHDAASRDDEYYGDTPSMFADWS
jgi:uncharacterized membrane protein YidH (DUF202 family)